LVDIRLNIHAVHERLGPKTLIVLSGWDFGAMKPNEEDAYTICKEKKKAEKDQEEDKMQPSEAPEEPTLRPSNSTLAKPEWHSAEGHCQVMNDTFLTLDQNVQNGSVNLWIVDPPFNVLENDEIEPEALDKLVPLMEAKSAKGAVGLIYLSRDGQGTSDHDWRRRLANSQLVVKNKMYFRTTNKSSGGGSKRFAPLPTIQEALVFAKEGNDTEFSDFHLHYIDPRVDWRTDFMEEYVLLFK